MSGETRTAHPNLFNSLQETKDRQIRNILLRLFQYFLFMLYVNVTISVPAQQPTDLVVCFSREDGLNTHLQQLVSTMDEATLESKFQVEALSKKLEVS
jgi:hypothetical protein